MRVSRIQVEEGFLNGLDLEFGDGLNVLIGARGTGKTSIIELLRFCLDVPAYSSSFAERARKHALSILGPGQVTVTIESNGERYSVSRSADDDAPRLPPFFLSPIILSQAEIESIALDSAGKLRLVDSFGVPSQTSDDEALLARIRSQTAQIKSLTEEITALEEQISALANADQDLHEALRRETEILATVKETESHQAKLEEIGREAAVLGVRHAVFERTEKAISNWHDKLDKALSAAPTLEAWPPAAGGSDQLTEIRNTIADVEQLIADALSKLSTASNKIASLSSSNASSRSSFDSQARELRQYLEGLKEGAGSAARRVAELREKSGQRSALSSLKSERARQLAEIKAKRSIELTKLDESRKSLFEARRKAAHYLTDQLSPAIEVEIERAAAYAQYESAIAEALRGSGLHYKSLAEQLARRLSPRELAEAIEDGSSRDLAKLAGIPDRRADRAITFAREFGVEGILTSLVDDVADLSLLVGGDYSSLDHLSTGQRCTVILPILLCDHGRILVVDQPEDHLDNAFVVETVIKSVRARSNQGQLIFSTHNPNIPVLGDAARVVWLDSDGKRGFVRHAGSLEDSTIVDGIASVMEGGREAFARRAKFYGKT